MLRIAFLLLLLASGLGGAADSALPVSVAPVSGAQAAATLPLSGELKAIRATELSAEIAGVVEKVLVEAGDPVAADVALAQLRRKPATLRLQALRAEVNEAKAGVERAQIRERRISGLLASKAVSQDDYDVAKVELAQSRAQMAARQAAASQQADTLARLTLRAPFAGVLTARYVEAGQWLAVGDPVFGLADVTQLRGVFAVPQQYFGRLRKGSEVSVQVGAAGADAFVGKISAILPAVERAGRSFNVWVDIDNSAGLVAAGMSAKVALPVFEQGASALLLARDAVLRDATGTTFVWALEGDNKIQAQEDPIDVAARRVVVKVQNSVGDKVAVISKDLAVGDHVVVRGNESLKDGVRVKARLFGAVQP